MSPTAPEVNHTEPNRESQQRVSANGRNDTSGSGRWGEQEPNYGSVREALGKAGAGWDDLVGHLAEVYSLKGSFHFMYGQRYGWALRFRRGGKLIAAMYPNRGRLTVQVVLGRAQVTMGTEMRLSSSISKVLKAAKDYPEGRWLFVPVRSREDAREMRSLIALKLRGPNRTGNAGGNKAEEFDRTPAGFGTLG